MNKSTYRATADMKARGRGKRRTGSAPRPALFLLISESRPAKMSDPWPVLSPRWETQRWRIGEYTKYRYFQRLSMVTVPGCSPAKLVVIFDLTEHHRCQRRCHYSSKRHHTNPQVWEEKIQCVIGAV